MLPVFRNKRHPRVHVPEPGVLQPSLFKGWGIFLVALLPVIGLMYAAFAVYELGNSEAGFDRQQARDIRRGLEEELADVEAQRDELLQHVATYGRTVQIDREAMRQVRESLVELQDERLELREEVAFLTSLLSDGKIKAGLRARHFTIEPLESAGQYRYRFTLSKYPQDGEVVEATLKLAVAGMQNDEEATVNLEKIVIGDALTKLEFKQLTQVEGALALPDGFVPETVRVKVAPKAKDVLGIEEAFAWDAEQ